MTEEIIDELPEVLKSHICKIKKTSKEDNQKEYMTDSKLKVVNFDKISKEYCKGKGWNYLPCSNDALYISSEQEWYFIEFKNGSIEKGELYRKIYDSLIMLIELDIIPDFQYARKHFNYILVYNSEKYPRIQESESRDKTHSYILGLAKEEKRLFEVYKFDGYLFKKTHTYNKDEFNEKFIKIMEKLESQP